MAEISGERESFKAGITEIQHCFEDEVCQFEFSVFQQRKEANRLKENKNLAVLQKNTLKRRRQSRQKVQN